MVKYELHLNGEKQDKRQFNTPMDASKYLQQLKDTIFKNRNYSPIEYKKNLNFVNSLEIVPIETGNSRNIYSVVEIEEIGCSVFRNFDNLEQAESFKRQIIKVGSTRLFDIIETKIYDS